MKAKTLTTWPPPRPNFYNNLNHQIWLVNVIWVGGFSDNLIRWKIRRFRARWKLVRRFDATVGSIVKWFPIIEFICLRPEAESAAVDVDVVAVAPCHHQDPEQLFLPVISKPNKTCCIARSSSAVDVINKFAMLRHRLLLLKIVSLLVFKFWIQQSIFNAPTPPLWSLHPSKFYALFVARNGL